MGQGFAGCRNMSKRARVSVSCRPLAAQRQSGCRTFLSSVPLHQQDDCVSDQSIHSVGGLADAGKLHGCRFVFCVTSLVQRDPVPTGLAPKHSLQYGLLGTQA